MKKIRNFLLLFIFMAAMSVSVKCYAAEVRVLCLNGTGDYSAKMFYDALTSGMYINGLEVKTSDSRYFEQPSREKITKTIEFAFNGASSDDISVFFYSGHGTSIGEEKGIYTSDKNIYKFSDLYQKLKTIRGKKLVILDCCYSGQLISYSSVDSSFTVLTACEGNNESYSPVKQGNVSYTHFSKYLLKGLGYGYNQNMKADSNKNHAVSGKELYDYLKKNYSKNYLYTATKNKNGKEIAGKKVTKPVPQYQRGKGISLSYEKIRLKESFITLYVNQSQKLHASGTNHKITWSSSNKKVATVSANGTVKAKKPGKTIIKASANGMTASCHVTVKSVSVKLNKKSAKLNLNKKKTIQLEATVTGTNAGVTWYSSDCKIASVNASGKVTAKKAGKVTITASTGGVSAKCVVTVIAGKKIPSDAVKWNGHYYKIYEGGKTWRQAQKYCKNLGGYLVTVTSQSEQILIQNLISGGRKNSYWMGGYVDQNRGWHWVTGESFSYSNWADGQPDNYYESGFENVLMIYKNKQPNGNGFGQWNDLNEDGTCGEQPFFGMENIGFICEWS